MEKSEIYTIFAKRKKRRQLMNILLVASFLGYVILGYSVRDMGNEVENLIIWAAIITFIVPVIIIFVDWRCPNCDKPLGREMNITYCYQCGEKLTEFID